MTGHYNKYVADAAKTVAQIRVSRQVVRKFDAGQIANILTVRDHRFEQVELDDATQTNIATGARKLQGQRGSPGTRAYNRYCP
jgi:hypothetical protein